MDDKLREFILRKRQDKDKLLEKVNSEDYSLDSYKSAIKAKAPSDDEITDEHFDKMDDEAYVKSPEGKAAKAKKAKIEALKMLRDGKY